ncbi:thymidine kinase [Pseudomonas viridiflava]|uniref:thymidine kinase n=1 Tax=Pseudomonas viridiflava TaxID=33069 RepID=UPI001E49A924|nr:thymidine kinase [Pseudomonas viridiflava]
MSSFTFYYGSMNAGKSGQLIQTAHSFQERNMHVVILKSSMDTRDGPGLVKSRVGGISKPCINFSADDNLSLIIKEQIRKLGKISCVLIDEAQFLTKEQVKSLAEIVDFDGINIYAYGLRTDAFGDLFPGSMYLLAFADSLRELNSLCHCGEHARMNLRYDAQGDVVTSGEQNEVGGNDRYIPLCRKHWLQAHRSKRIPEQALFRKVA